MGKGGNRLLNAVLLCPVVFYGCYRSTPEIPSASHNVSEAIFSAVLHAELRNATVGRGDCIELDFVLFNQCDVPIVLAERWNSWGARQWTFRVTDANGAAYSLTNPQDVWFANMFTTFTIQPSSEQVTPCRLDMDCRSFSDGWTAVFTRGQSPRPNSWVFPLSISGTFAAQRYEKTSGHEGTNWAGSITTKPVLVRKAPNKPDAGDGQ